MPLTLLLSWNFSYDFVKNHPDMSGFFFQWIYLGQNAGYAMSTLFMPIFCLLVTGNSEKFFLVKWRGMDNYFLTVKYKSRLSIFSISAYILSLLLWTGSIESCKHVTTAAKETPCEAEGKTETVPSIFVAVVASLQDGNWWSLPSSTQELCGFLPYCIGMTSMITRTLQKYWCMNS